MTRDDRDERGKRPDPGHVRWEEYDHCSVHNLRFPYGGQCPACRDEREKRDRGSGRSAT